MAKCEHTATRPSADGDLELCLHCSRIVRALTPKGEAELKRILQREGIQRE